MSTKPTEICYLCNRTIDPNTTDELTRRSEDHIPAMVIHPKTLRPNLKKNLPKAPTHQGCNSKYQNDEEYFARVMSLLVGDKSKAGSALFEDLAGHVKRHPKQAKVVRNIVRGVKESTPSGIVMPPGKLAVQLDGKRIENVIWKITRGLYFLNFMRILPENHKHLIVRYNPGTKLPDWIQDYFIKAVVAAGANPEIFVYKYGHRTESPKEHTILMRFWQVSFFVCHFDDLGCDCKNFQSGEPKHGFV